MECSPKTFNELRQIARDRGTAGYWKLRKAYLIEAIIRHDPLIVIETTKDIIVLWRMFQSLLYPLKRHEYSFLNLQIYGRQ